MTRRPPVDAPRESLVRSAPFQLERNDTDGLTLTGHGAVFNQWTEINSWEGKFRERIAPGAFKKTLAENGSRVRLQFDHGQHPLIGSLPIGVIRKLREDSKGLLVEARLSDNWLVQPVRDAIAEGSIDGMSFRFTVEKESWDQLDSDLPERTITEVRLMEVGPVVWPAYDKTDVGVRSLELARNLMDADDDTRREVAHVLLQNLEDPTGTSDTEAADSTSEDEAARSTEEHSEPPEQRTEADEVTSEPAPHSQPYQPAVRPRLSSDRLREQAAEVKALAAAAQAAKEL
jgi:uncharacterized protein